jgi:DNA invertase Pin-like site-specific DNA recombinase
MDALKSRGVEKIYSEKMSGTKADRPQLIELLKVLRKGDTLVVWKLDRLGRTVKQLVDLVEQFSKDGINFVSIQDSIDTTTATGKALFGMLCVMAQMERDIISERTRAGLASARARGRNGGRPTKQNDKVNLALKMYDSKDYSIPQILDATGLSKTTIYRYINTRQGATV